MGGLGSGRVSAQHRAKVEQARFIPSGWVQERMGVQRTGIAMKVSWKQGGQPFGEAGMVLFDQRLHIAYRKRSDGEEQRGGCLPKVFASFLSNGERRCNRSFTFKSSKIKDRLGGDPYQRPKRMHRNTFDRLRMQYFAVSQEAEKRSEERLIALEGGF